MCYCVNFICIYKSATKVTFEATKTNTKPTFSNNCNINNMTKANIVAGKAKKAMRNSTATLNTKATFMAFNQKHTEVFSGALTKQGAQEQVERICNTGYLLNIEHVYEPKAKSGWISEKLKRLLDAIGKMEINTELMLIILQGSNK